MDHPTGRLPLAGQGRHVGCVGLFNHLPSCPQFPEEETETKGSGHSPQGRGSPFTPHPPVLDLWQGDWGTPEAHQEGSWVRTGPRAWSPGSGASGLGHLL